MATSVIIWQFRAAIGGPTIFTKCQAWNGSQHIIKLNINELENDKRIRNGMMSDHDYVLNIQSFTSTAFWFFKSRDLSIKKWQELSVSYPLKPLTVPYDKDKYKHCHTLSCASQGSSGDIPNSSICSLGDPCSWSGNLNDLKMILVKLVSLVSHVDVPYSLLWQSASNKMIL